MTDTGLPPDLPGEARPNFGAQPIVGAQLKPVYPPPAYTPPPYAPPAYPSATGTSMSTGAKVGLFAGLGCLAVIVVPIIILASIGFSTALSSDDDYDPWQPSTDGSEVTSNGNTVGAVESQWKTGDDWLTVPAGELAPKQFVPGFDTAQEWLHYNMGADYDLSVVFTSDPTLNCGLALAEPLPDSVIGCYDADYGDTLFIWWGDQASDDLKTLGLLHEYSHFWQHWENFDAMRSAEDAGLLADAEFIADVVEPDATCRIYVDWHYTKLRLIDDQLVSPCGDTGWGKHYLENELLERGVTVTDY